MLWIRWSPVNICDMVQMLLAFGRQALIFQSTTHSNHWSLAVFLHYTQVVSSQLPVKAHNEKLMCEKVPFPISTWYVESESRPEGALKGPSAVNQSVRSDFEIWRLTAASSHLWSFSVALMTFLGNRCLLTLCLKPCCLPYYSVCIIFKNQKPRKAAQTELALI